MPSSPAVRMDLEIDGGVVWPLKLPYFVDEAGTNQEDIAGWDAEAEFLDEFGGTSLVKLTVGSGITIDTDDSEIQLELSTTQSATLADNSPGAWLLDVTPSGGSKERHFYGRFTARKGGSS